MNFAAELDNSLTAQNIVKLLPVESVVSKWGEEIFFGINEVQDSAASRTIQVNVGDVAFCPSGNCLCVFLGPTPASAVLEKPVPENPVVVIGRVLSFPEELRGIKPGERVKVALAEKTTLGSAKNAQASERKLTQAEIDILVKQLLEEKRRSGR